MAVAAEVADRVPGVAVAPAVAFGSSGEHQSFAGTLSIGTDALTTVLVELGRSALPADGSGPFAAVVLVNGHGGNIEATRAAHAVLTAESRRVKSWSPRLADGDAHAGRAETSLLLAIAPDVVGDARPIGNTESIQALLPALCSGGIGAVSPNGVLGDARGASAEEGERILDQFACDLAVTVTTIASSL